MTFVVSLLVFPAIASAQWLPAVDLSDPGEFGFDQEPQVAVDAAGGAVVVWPQLRNHYVVQAATKVADGGWDRAVDLSPAGEDSLEPQVAMNASGDAIAAWVHRGSQRIVKAASRTSEGAWGSAEQISIPGYSATDVDVAIDPAGNAVAVWTQYDDTTEYIVEAATRPAGGQWGMPVELSEAGRNAWEPRLAVDPSSHAVVAVWYRYDDSGDTIVQAADRQFGNVWSEPEDLSDPGADAYLAEVESSAGKTVVVWERDQVVEAVARKAGGPWLAPLEIAEPGSGEAAIGMDASGNAVVVWSSEYEDGLVVEATTLWASGGWTEPIALSEPQLVEVTQPQVAVDPVGRAMAIWRAWDGTERVAEAAAGAVKGGWGSPVTVSSPKSWAQSAQIAMDSEGDAVAVWKAYEPQRMQAALFETWKAQPAPAPVPSDSADRPAAVTSASVAFARRLVIVKNGKALLQLQCPGLTTCQGRARLARRVIKRKGLPYSSSLGGARFTIPSELGATVAIKLTPRGVSLVAAGGRRGVVARLGGSAIEPRSVILKPAS